MQEGVCFDCTHYDWPPIITAGISRIGDCQPSYCLAVLIMKVVVEQYNHIPTFESALCRMMQ